MNGNGKRDEIHLRAFKIRYSGIYLDPGPTHV